MAKMVNDKSNKDRHFKHIKHIYNIYMTQRKAGRNNHDRNITIIINNEKHKVVSRVVSHGHWCLCMSNELMSIVDAFFTIIPATKLVKAT